MLKLFFVNRRSNKFEKSSIIWLLSIPFVFTTKFLFEKVRKKWRSNKRLNVICSWIVNYSALGAGWLYQSDIEFNLNSGHIVYCTLRVLFRLTKAKSCCWRVRFSSLWRSKNGICFSWYGGLCSCFACAVFTGHTPRERPYIRIGFTLACRNNQSLSL